MINRIPPKWLHQFQVGFKKPGCFSVWSLGILLPCKETWARILRDKDCECWVPGSPTVLLTILRCQTCEWNHLWSSSPVKSPYRISHRAKMPPIAETVKIKNGGCCFKSLSYGLVCHTIDNWNRGIRYNARQNLVQHFLTFAMYDLSYNKNIFTSISLLF